MSVQLVRARRTTVLEVATEVLVSRPRAALAEVAQAAGIGRTTLHKQYPTRDDLLVAVAHRALDELHAAVDDASASLPADDSDADAVTGALERLATSFVPLGPELAFLLRTPGIDEQPDVTSRFDALEPPITALVKSGQRIGLLRDDLPHPWFVSSLYAQTYAAWEGVAAGWLAPRDAPELVISTLLMGFGGELCRSPDNADGTHLSRERR